MNLLIVSLTDNEAVSAQFRVKRGEAQFLGATRQTVAEDGDLSAILATIATGGTPEQRVILALPAGIFYTRELDLPVTDRRKLRELLPLELKGETALDTDELVFDAVPLDSGKVMAVWARQRDLAEPISLLTAAGIEPEIVTSSLFQWERLIPAGDAGRTVALTDGEGLAVYREGKPLAFRHLGNGSSGEEIARTLAAVEISRGCSVEAVYRLGRPPAESPDEEYAGLAALPLAGGCQTAFAGDSATALDLAPHYAIAATMAAGEPLNLRTGKLAYTAGRNRVRKRFRLSMILAAIALALFIGETGVRYLMVKRDLDSLNSSIRGIYREVFPSRKKAVDEVGELRSEIKRLGAGSGSSKVLDLLKELAEAKGDEVNGIYEADINGRDITLKGDARSIQAVNDFKVRASAWVNSAEVSEIKSRPDGSVTFVFHGLAKEGNK